jgi:hypothetical protein
VRVDRRARSTHWRAAGVRRACRGGGRGVRHLRVRWRDAEAGGVRVGSEGYHCGGREGLGGVGREALRFDQAVRLQPMNVGPNSKVRNSWLMGM